MEEKIDFLDKTPTSDTSQDFLYKLDMKPYRSHTFFASILCQTYQTHLLKYGFCKKWNLTEFYFLEEY